MAYFHPPTLPTPFPVHLLLHSPSCTHQTYILWPLWGQGSQSALAASCCPNSPRIGNPQRIFSHLNMSCDPYLDWIWPRGLAHQAHGPSITAETTSAVSCPETQQGQHHRSFPLPMAHASKQTLPGCECSVAWEKEARQCLGCHGAGYISSVWVGLGRRRSAGPVYQRQHIGKQEPTPGGRKTTRGRWGCTGPEALSLVPAALSQAAKCTFTHTKYKFIDKIIKNSKSANNEH